MEATAEKPRHKKPKPSTMQPLLLKDTDLAAVLQICRQGVWRLLAQGKLPAPIKIGNSTRWRAGEFHQWLAMQQTRR